MAVVLRRNGRLHLRVGAADGSDFQTLAESLNVRGVACWSPDGKWLVIGAHDGNGAGLFKISVEGRRASSPRKRSRAGSGLVTDGFFIVYAGANLGVFSPLLAVHPDNTPAQSTEIGVRTLGERARFLPSGKGMVYMQGEFHSQDFWLLDLATQTSRPLTHLNNPATMPDGKQIVFDRVRENSDIVLIDLKH